MNCIQVLLLLLSLSVISNSWYPKSWGSPPDSSVPGISQARILKCCHFLLQGILLAQGSNPCLLLSTFLSGSFTTEPPRKLQSC